MRRRWTAAEDALLRERYPDTRTADLTPLLGHTLTSIYQRARRVGLSKSEAFRASPASGRTNGRQGLGTRFVKGQAPANKGVRHRKGWAPGRMADTQFKKGVRQGVAARLWRPIGTERISKDGYLERKVNDGMQKRWRAVHLIVWEDANGALPEGHAVTFVNNDRADRRLTNLKLVSRADLMLRNAAHKHNLPPALKKAVYALGTLKANITKKTKRIAREKQNRRSA